MAPSLPSPARHAAGARGGLLAARGAEREGGGSAPPGGVSRSDDGRSVDDGEVLVPGRL